MYAVELGLLFDRTCNTDRKQAFSIFSSSPYILEEGPHDESREGLSSGFCRLLGASASFVMLKRSRPSEDSA